MIIHLLTRRKRTLRQQRGEAGLLRYQALELYSSLRYVFRLTMPKELLIPAAERVLEIILLGRLDETIKSQSNYRHKRLERMISRNNDTPDQSHVCLSSRVHWYTQITINGRKEAHLFLTDLPSNSLVLFDLRYFCSAIILSFMEKQ